MEKSRVSLSDTGNLFSRGSHRPLADQFRPQSLEEIVGQDHLLGPGQPLRALLDSGTIASLILWGPPGCGKTTLARILAHHVNLVFESISAVLSGVPDLRKLFDQAKGRHKLGQGTLLFVDEIHRFNRAQQDSFLGYVEDGTIILVGATTENPSFELNGALLSRCQVFTLRRLGAESLEFLLQRAEKELKKPLPLTPEARSVLIQMSDGDGRMLFNFVEALQSYKAEDPLSPEALSKILQRRAPLYDKSQEGHYNLISALHKSLRGSDVDAALYWLARMLVGGENPMYIARRLVRFATEDIGMGDPQALTQAMAAQQAYHFLGSPEGNLALAQCVIYLATAPKSNKIYAAFGKAMAVAREKGSLMPPKHILNAPTDFMRQEGYGKGYQYDPETEKGFSGQNYFPDAMDRETFYEPLEQGFEREIKKRLAYWKKLRNQKKQV